MSQHLGMVLIDSSSWIEALRAKGSPVVRRRVRDLLENGQAAWCPMVRLELWNGCAGSAEQKILRGFDRDLPLLPIDADVWRLACDLARRCRALGISVRATDLLIFACAEHHHISIEHCDDHFTQLQSLGPA